MFFLAQYFLTCIYYGKMELIFVNGLAQIVSDSQMNRPLGICKIVISRHNDKLGITNGRRLLNQGQAIQGRHADICNYKIRFQMPDKLQRFPAVPGFSDNFTSQSFPVRGKDKPPAKDLFIFCNYTSNHFSIPPKREASK